MRFKEDDIRPSSFEEGKKKALLVDLQCLASKKNQFVEIPCPACGSKCADFLFEKYSFSFVSCRDCETVYMNPRATQEILNDFYANSVLYDYWNKFIFPASREVRRKEIFKPRVERTIEICRNYDVPMNCLVEVGAGFGIFCDEAKKTGQFDRVIAIEPNKELAETCRSLGLEVVEKSVENIEDLGTIPNIIACFEVIEHLFSPKSFLRKCWNIMGYESIIVVTCPNYKGFDLQALGVRSDSVDAEHINLFNPESLTLLFKSCNFEVLEWATPGELDAEIVRKKALSGEYSVERRPLMRTILLDRWEEIGGPFQVFLKENKLSSHLWMVGKKIR
jgi:2-polyprenyl-3-methyl-5-hydroxy-6-metoxy-1,4-benzoquinol methylase